MEHKTKLFVFSKVYNNSGGLHEIKYCEEAIPNLEVEWHKYWREHGGMIVNSSWITLYRDYINPDYKYLDESTKKLNLNEENCRKKIASEDIEESDWQTLWDEQYQYEYTNYFNLFSENFYNAEKYFKLNQEFSFRKNNPDDIILTTINDSDMLKALGLPTAFASSTHSFKFQKRTFENEEEFNKMDEVHNEIYGPKIENCYIQKLKSENLNVDPNVQGIQSLKPNCKIKSKKRLLRKIPSYIQEDKVLIKYWRKRFQLFSRFDQGIKLDKESWFSVTPEEIAKNIAIRMSHCDIVIDGFCGSGGNCIQLAMKCKKVIAIDIDPIKIEMAKHNAKIYKVDQNIEFIVGDFLQLSENLKADGLILSVPWGGPKYKEHLVYDVEKCLLPLPASELLKRCRKITENIAMFIPKNSDKEQIIRLAGVSKQVEIVQNYICNRLIALTCYYGNLIDKRT